jgi:mannose-6-phosphate isomerase-like protein (cupin superfamily)
MHKSSKANAQHYNWGDNCDGWRLVDSPKISIIHERMPPGTSEKTHYHKKADQFFFIVEGNASIEAGENIYNLGKYEGIEIPAGSRHRFFNSSDQPVEFIVTSIPPALNDRYE